MDHVPFLECFCGLLPVPGRECQLEQQMASKSLKTSSKDRVPVGWSQLCYSLLSFTVPHLHGSCLLVLGMLVEQRGKVLSEPAAGCLGVCGGMEGASQGLSLGLTPGFGGDCLLY